MLRSPRVLVVLALWPATACFDPPMIRGDSEDSTTESPGTTTDAPGTTGPGEGTTGSPPATTDAPTTGETGVVDTGSSGSPDPCAVDPCVNGTCVAQGDAASCECELGWTGDVCDGCDDGYVMMGDQCVMAASCASDPCGPLASCSDDGGVVSCTRVFGFTGADQPWMVPAGVSSIDVVARGASGGCVLGGLGGEASATIPVMPGDIAHVRVGGTGACSVAATLPGGYNGGGDKFTDAGDSWEGGSGGGGTDLRLGGITLTHRVIVAGGGGGQGWGGQAGHGGGEEGQTCDGVGGGCADETCGGRGGTQLAGGIGGFCYTGCEGQPGVLGVGGTSDGCAAAGGGGGGGYFGGGGGAHCSGGGGSSRVDFPGNTNTSTTTGVQLGDGELTLVWWP
ncbi:MAG: hypothetical protein H6712_33845 [Myxococcales bacterium]|nr:hypothetical protein [Myxococcales bacterium]MCB9718876.1 hypothetical protein [Myxococcales bacterium]